MGAEGIHGHPGESARGGHFAAFQQATLFVAEPRAGLPALRSRVGSPGVLDMPGPAQHDGRVPHINLPELPGMVGLLVQYPHTAGPLNGLADALLRGPSPLTPGERETIAAYVSSRNECAYCSGIHGAVAAHLLHQEGRPAEHAETDPKMQALLSIAEKVRVDGRSVSRADIDEARRHGADDKTVHDTVLIAAAFSMYNRYVDGLATLAPEHPEVYARHAKNLAEGGYLTPLPPR